MVGAATAGTGGLPNSGRSYYLMTTAEGLCPYLSRLSLPDGVVTVFPSYKRVGDFVQNGVSDGRFVVQLDEVGR